MNKKIILTIGLVIILAIAGYWFLTQSNAENVIKIKNGESFSVTLESNPTTGYMWETEYDKNYIQFIDRQFKPSSGEQIIGAGGSEIFNFVAIGVGESEILFSYLRPWENEKPAEKTEIYNIIVK